MSKICKLTQKRHLIGHKISHSNIKSKRRFDINIKVKRFWLATEKRFIKLRVSTKGIRIIDKLGIENALKKMHLLANDIKK